MKSGVNPGSTVEWPTLGVAVLAYGGFGLAVMFGDTIGWVATAVLLTLCIALHSSLQHEILHGHPFKNRLANEALAFPAIGLFIPYGRFRDTHMAHHHDPNLTDPYDDPESNFADPEVWVRLPRWRQKVAVWNNTLLGRMILGPTLSVLRLWADDWRQVQEGQGPVIRAYVLHIAGVALVGAIWANLSAVGVWIWVCSAYAGMSVLKIRTYLEHRAHDHARARTVIIEDRGPLAFLFLNNNLHAVHHCHPQVPWYTLWHTYIADKPGYLRRNDGYVYRSYGQIFRAFFLQVKDPVPHPLMQAGRSVAPAIDREAMHTLGPLQPDQPALDPRQEEQAQPNG